MTKHNNSVWNTILCRVCLFACLSVSPCWIQIFQEKCLELLREYATTLTKYLSIILKGCFTVHIHRINACTRKHVQDQCHIDTKNSLKTSTSTKCYVVKKFREVTKYSTYALPLIKLSQSRQFSHKGARATLWRQ